MATRLLGGPKTFNLVRDKDRYRTYLLTLQVLSDDTLDGPEVVSNTPGLPLPGSVWAVGNDLDPWVWCKWGPSTITPNPEKLPTLLWNAQYTFSNKPDDYCQLIDRLNPLLEPPVISGGFVRKKEEAATDVFGNQIVNSAWEVQKGPQVEFDADSPTVKISMNVANLNLPILSLASGKVNAFPLWGLPPRTIKLAPPSWERKFYKGCQVYYTWHLEFEIRYETWDRLLPDEGTRVLPGTWTLVPGEQQYRYVLRQLNGGLPNPAIPAHFVAYTDPKGNQGHVQLNGSGLPANVIVNKGAITPPLQQVTKVDVQNAGQNYVVGDLLAATGGTGTPAQFLVNEVSDSGAIIGIQIAFDPTTFITFNGSYSVIPTNPVALSGGTGTGAMANLTFGQIPGAGAFYSGPPGKIFLEKYEEFDFATYLALPLSF